MSGELEDLTEKIRGRLSEQNKILEDCVQKYQQSQLQRKEIAIQIQKITTELTGATKNLQEIEKNHNDFNTARANKIQQYEEEKQKMMSEYNDEKQRLESEKTQAVADEVKKSGILKADLEQKAKDAQAKGAEDQKAIDEQKAAERQAEFDNAKKLADEKLAKQQEDITNFQNQLKNDKETAEAQRKELEDKHKNDVAVAKTNEEKIETLTNQNKELHTQIENDNKKHQEEIEALGKKGKDELELAGQFHINTMKKQEETLAEQEREKIEALNKTHQEAIERLKGEMLATAETSNATNKAELEAVQGKLKLCNEKFQAFETEYANNKEALNNIQKQFQEAENIAATALKDNVDKLAAENKVLQEQIKKMMGESKQQTDQQGQKQIGDNESKGGDVPPAPPAPPAPQAEFRPPPPSHIEQAKNNKVVKKFTPRKIESATQTQHTFAIVQGAGGDVAKNVTGAQINIWVNAAGHSKKFNFGLLNKKFIDLFMNSEFYVSNGMEKHFSTATHTWEREMHKAIAAFWVNSGKEKIVQLLKSKPAIESLSQNDIVGPMYAWQKEFKKDLHRGGYKHGKKSNKRMKRSLKSKLSARKFSLKKRSKRKKKGKSKKRRKSIKIRI